MIQERERLEFTIEDRREGTGSGKVSAGEENQESEGQRMCPLLGGVRRKQNARRCQLEKQCH